jgi:hypothetical protein
MGNGEFVVVVVLVGAPADVFGVSGEAGDGADGRRTKGGWGKGE